MALPEKPEILSKDRDSLSEQEQKAYDIANAKYARAIREHFNLIFNYTSPVKPPERDIVGRDGLMESMLAAFARPELSNVLLLAEAGSGKALADNTLIPVADKRFAVPIKDLVQGDMVYSPDGTTTLVQGVFPQGEIDAFEVTFDNGSSVIANGEHLWQTADGRTIKLSEAVPNETEIPISSPVDFPKTKLPIDPYVLGVFLASCQTSAPYVNLSRVPEDVVSRFAKLVHAASYKFEDHSKRWILYSGGSFQGKPLRLYNKAILEGEEAPNLIGYDSHKRLPSKYIHTSFANRWKLLQALMDSTGILIQDVYGSHVYFAADSKFLVEDVKNLAASLGIAADTKRNPAFNTLRKRFVTEFYPSEEEIKKFFLAKSKKEELKEFLADNPCGFAKKETLTFKEIVPLENTCSMTCIAVDSPSHCFLAGNDCVVTHNTALVQGLSARDKDRIYLEVDLARMIAAMPDANALAAALKLLFDQVAEYNQMAGSKEAVLFMDEFHQIVQISAVAVEALKPLLADSGTRGIRVICATTYREFRDNISKNQPLVERLQRINVPEPDKETTVAILKGMAERYGVAQDFWTAQMFDLIYEYTERYIPANAQPRKSLLVLDAMIGWHRATGRQFDTKLLADVLFESEGVNVAFRVNAGKIKENLDARVYAQDYATSTIARRLQLCVADLNDHSKPMSSFLFTGSTGVGKAVLCDSKIPVANSGTPFKLAKDIEIGDLLFNREGKPVEVLGVFPQGKQVVYRVSFSDGRHLDVSGEHLWRVYDEDKSKSRVITTSAIASSDQKLFIDMNGAVQWSRKEASQSAYAVGKRLVVSCAEHIPSEYKYTSINQRMQLLRGIFDTSGDFVRWLFCTVESKSLAEDIQEVLFSLGYQSRIKCTEVGQNKFDVIVQTSKTNYSNFVTAANPELYETVVQYNDSYYETSHYDFVEITSVSRLDKSEDMVCFYVDDQEHLFQAENFVVTHNTETVKQLVQLLFGDDRALIRMDMTEFANPESIERFRDELTTRVWEHQHSVILLDEIEKSHESITKLLLQVLDDGRLTDRNGREVSFLNAYIVMTTNVASEIYQTVAQYRSSDTGSHESMADFDKVIRRSIMSTAGEGKFPPELLGRIDTIVPFQPLSEATRRRIVINKLSKLHDEIEAKHRVDMRVDKRVIDYLVGDVLDEDSDSGGARVVVSKLEEEVTCSVAEFINLHPAARTIFVNIEGQLASEDKASRVGDARVVVTATRNK